MGKLFMFALIVCAVLYGAVKYKHIVMPIAETGTAVVDLVVDKVATGADTLVKEAKAKHKPK
jgi:hypothetical protein